MLAAIQLDDERRLTTGKVSDVWPDGQLSDKLVLSQLSATNQVPQFVLGIGFVAA